MKTKLILQKQNQLLKNYSIRYFTNEIEIKKRVYKRIFKVISIIFLFNLSTTTGFIVWNYIDYNINLLNPKLNSYHTKRLG